MNWKEELRQLKLSYIKEKSPGFYELSGGERIKLKPWSDTTTNGLTACVFNWLKYNNHWVNRINSTGVARKINGKLTYTSGLTNRGTADLTTIINSKVVMIEIKNAFTRDRVSKYQLTEKARLEASGGIYIVVTEMESFVSWYKSFVLSSASKNELKQA